MKIMSWTPIKSEDVKGLQSFSPRMFKSNTTNCLYEGAGFAFKHENDCFETPI